MVGDKLHFIPKQNCAENDPLFLTFETKSAAEHALKSGSALDLRASPCLKKSPQPAQLYENYCPHSFTIDRKLT